MQGDIEQALALTVVGNGHIAGRPPGNFWPGAKTFTFTRQCNFTDERGEEIAANPNLWLARAKERCRGLWLHAVPRGKDDRMTVGFAGGGPRWIIETLGPQDSELWEGASRFEDRGPRAPGSWNTTYTRIAANWNRLRQEQRALEEIIADLERTLSDISALAEASGLEAFHKCFRSALAALTGSLPFDAGRFGDIAPFAEFAPGAQRLLGAVKHGWVFGGMGSWNDSGPDGPATQSLFALLVESVCAVANSTFRP